jgi:hypothetical protein
LHSPVVAASVPSASRIASAVLAPLLEVLQRPAPAQDVVGQVQHVIRLVVGQVHLQQPQVLVEGGGQTRPLRQQVHRPDPARAQPPYPSAALVVKVAAPQHRLRLRLPVAPPQPPPNSLLAARLALLYS